MGLQLPADGHVILAVYNSLGQEVRKIIDGEARSGYRVVKFDAKDLASGVYYYRLQAGGLVRTDKMILTR